MTEVIYLANGKAVPKICINALNELNELWPGATFQGARPAIVAAILEAVYFDREIRCQSCQGRIWNVKLGKWIYSRETVGLVCPECGRDYSKPNVD